MTAKNTYGENLANKQVVKKKQPNTPKTSKDTKSNVYGFQGGLPVNLDRKMKDGQVLREKLRIEIGELLQQELDNQQERIDKIPEWNRLYRGQRDDREPGLANVATPIPRILTDAIAVRVFEGIYSQPDLFTASATKESGATEEENEMWANVARELENDVNWWVTDIDLKKKLFDPINQSVKIGKGLLMMWPKSEKRTIVRRATAKEKSNKSIKTFKLSNGEYGVKIVETVSQQPDVFPISREDWVQSIDQSDIQKALLCGYRTYMRKPDIDLRVTQSLFDSIESKKMTIGEDIDDVKKERAESEKKVIPDHTRDKFAVWQLNYRSDVDEDGEEDDIMIWYNPQTKAIPRCIYNPMFAGFRPFIDFVFNPSEYAPDGEGTMEILEKPVEEIDTLHNQRIDRISQINGPIIIKREGVRGLEDMTIRPRQIYEVDDVPSEVLYEFRFSDQTISNSQEEAHLIDLCMKAVGVTPDVLGQPTSDRPVFREMASRQAEANKKFRFINRLYRKKIEDLGMMYLEMSAQYQPTHEYTVNGTQEQKTINYPLEYLRDRIKVKLSGSTELENKEVRKEQAQQRYAMLSQYYTNMAGMAQAVTSPQTPPEFKQFLILASQKSEKEMEKILQDMGMMNPEEAVMSLDDMIDVNKAMQTSGQPPPPGAEGGQGKPPSKPQGPQQAPNAIMGQQ